MTQDIATIAIYVLMIASALFLGGLVIYKGQLLSQSAYEEVLSGDRPFASTYWISLIVGVIFLALACLSFFAPNKVVGIYGGLICSGLAFYKLKCVMGLRKYRNEKKRKPRYSQV